MGRPKEYDDELRTRLIDTAGHLLASGGPHAVTLRQVARHAGTTTAAIYTLIGAKDALVRAMYHEGFRRLGDHLSGVEPNPDPLERVFQLGVAYYQTAIDNPHLYAVMCSNPIPEFRPNQTDAAYAYSKLAIIIHAVQDCVDAALLTGPAPEIARALWAIPHGVATLANTGMIATPQPARQLHDNLARAALHGLQHQNLTWPHPPPDPTQPTPRVTPNPTPPARPKRRRPPRDGPHSLVN